MTDAEAKLKFGHKYPFDLGDKLPDGSYPPFDWGDWATYAARGVVAELEGRHTIKHGFENVDEQTRLEIIKSISDIIRYAPQFYSERHI